MSLSSSWLLLSSLLFSAYLLGSISTAVLIGRTLGISDLRQHGSGNPGATNVLRILGKKAAVITLLGDVSKGIIPIVVGRANHLSTQWIDTLAFMSFLGHLYPVFFRFQGGKGVATGLGIVHLVIWPIGLTMDAIWLIVAKFWGYASLASIVSWLFGSGLGLWLAPQHAPLLLGMSLLIMFKHKSNIKKLWIGEESRFGQ